MFGYIRKFDGSNKAYVTLADNLKVHQSIRLRDGKMDESVKIRRGQIEKKCGIQYLKKSTTH